MKGFIRLGRRDVCGGTSVVDGGNSMGKGSKATEQKACLWDHRLFSRAGE